MKGFETSSFILAVLALSHTASALVARPPWQPVKTGCLPIPTGVRARGLLQPLSPTGSVAESIFSPGLPVPTGLAVSLVARKVPAGQNLSLTPIQASTLHSNVTVSLVAREATPGQNLSLTPIQASTRSTHEAPFPYSSHETASEPPSTPSTHVAPFPHSSNEAVSEPPSTPSTDVAPFPHSSHEAASEPPSTPSTHVAPLPYSSHEAASEPPSTPSTDVAPLPYSSHETASEPPSPTVTYSLQ